jgi:Ca2+/H+ antiporter
MFGDVGFYVVSYVLFVTVQYMVYPMHFAYSFVDLSMFKYSLNVSHVYIYQYVIPLWSQTSEQS